MMWYNTPDLPSTAPPNGTEKNEPSFFHKLKLKTVEDDNKKPKKFQSKHCKETEKRMNAEKEEVL